jgi:hypothetical protein
MFKHAHGPFISYGTSNIHASTYYLFLCFMCCSLEPLSIITCNDVLQFPTTRHYHSSSITTTCVTQPMSLRCNTSLVPMPLRPMPHGFPTTLGFNVICHYGLCQYGPSHSTYVTQTYIFTWVWLVLYVTKVYANKASHVSLNICHSCLGH